MSRSHQAFVAVREALDRGLVVHAYHPDFGGTVTAGPYQTADGAKSWAMLHHGGTCDVGEDRIDSTIELARRFVYQVGKQLAQQGADLALGKIDRDEPPIDLTVRAASVSVSNMNTEATEAKINAAATALAMGATADDVRVNLVDQGMSADEAALVVVAARILVGCAS